MSLDERRVTTALRTYAREIDVTDDDLDRLAARMRERLDPAPPRDGPGTALQWAVAACAVVALVLAGTALWRTRSPEALPATSSVISEDLAGVWLVDDPRNGGWLWHFTADGRLGLENTASGYVRVAEHEKAFTLEGDLLTFTDTGQRCRATVRQTADGKMALTPVMDPGRCELFLEPMTWSLVRVSPASVAGATLVADPNLLDRRPATEPAFMTDVMGTWLFEGTGTVLVVLRTSPRDGAYFLDDEGDGVSADQRGAVRLPTSGGIVLSPAAGAEQGCDTVYSRVVSTGDALEVELADTSCGRLGAARGRWIRLN